MHCYSTHLEGLDLVAFTATDGLGTTWVSVMDAEEYEAFAELVAGEIEPNPSVHIGFAALRSLVPRATGREPA
jgi:hypothetical protein